jgi:hypothetical protein
LAEAESTTENLSIVLAGLSVEAEKTTEKTSILVKQLEETSLFLIMARKKGTTIAPKNEYTIYYLVIPRTRNNTT